MWEEEEVPDEEEEMEEEEEGRADDDMIPRRIQSASDGGCPQCKREPGIRLNAKPFD